MTHRIAITLVPKAAGDLPFSYREAVQGLIYRLLPEETSHWLHEEGIATDRGRWKPFVFSRLQGKLQPDTATKTFRVTGPLTLKVASPLEELMEKLALGFIQNRTLLLAGLGFEVAGLELEPIPTPPPRAILVARAPITVFVKENGRRRYFGAPEPEFSERLVENLRMKARALGLTEAAQSPAKIEPTNPRPEHKKVERFRNLIVEGWMGRYRIEAPPELVRLALTAGLGALGSQGFGFVEVARDRRDRENR